MSSTDHAAAAARFRTIREFREMQPGDRGLVLYDGTCGLCTRFVRRWSGLLEKRRFRMVPLQAPGMAEALGVPEETLLDEMRVVTPAGVVLGGVDGMLHVARHVAWARPLRLVARLPGGMWLMRRLYRWVVDHRYDIGGHCPLPPDPGDRG